KLWFFSSFEYVNEDASVGYSVQSLDEFNALAQLASAVYALHDAMVKPMPGKALAPSLAESFAAAEDGRSYDFVLREGARFHNGDPVTSADVKFSFERYRGVAHDLFQARVEAVETPDARHVRFRLKDPWPDFLTFYATATGAGWVVPQRYVEKVGDDGFKKAPIGAGPYKFVSFTPGVELVLEAFDQYWRKKPSVQRLVFKVIPDESTRLAALRRGEIDIAYSVRGELAEQLRTIPGLTLKPAVVQGTFCLYFPDQWDEKSPWHDGRVRQAAGLAIDCQGTNEALTLGYSEITGNAIVPKGYDFYWQPPAPLYDPGKARQLLAAAGFPKGFDAGTYYCDASYANIGEAVVNNLLAVGIRSQLRPVERAAFIKEYSEKKYKNIIQAGPGAFGNAATRSTSSRPPSSMVRGAKRSSSRSSSSWSSGRSLRQSGSLPSSTVSARAWESRGLAGFRCFPTPRRTRTSRSRVDNGAAASHQPRGRHSLPVPATVPV
ncbi:MAG TPA: ABC transporter substrate-binding protein, partial [Reyranella sp.]|nr:ABC transporter substrate-binding protein [Reyranella sp.]